MSAEPSTAVKIPRPQLRNILERHLKKHMVIGFALSTVGMLVWKFGIMDPKQRRAKAFWDSYDAEKDFERMRQLGVFHSARPDNDFEGMDLSSIDLKKK